VVVPAMENSISTEENAGMFRLRLRLRMTPVVANGAMWTTLTPARMPDHPAGERLTSGPARRAGIGRKL